MAHATARVLGIALVAGNEVQVEMRHGLSGGFSAVDSDVVAVRVVVFLYGGFCRGQGAGQGLLFFFGGFEPFGDVAAGDEQGVAGTDRVLVPEADDQFGFVEDDVRVRVTEGASRVHGGDVSNPKTGSGFRGTAIGAGCTSHKKTRCGAGVSGSRISLARFRDNRNWKAKPVSRSGFRVPGSGESGLPGGGGLVALWCVACWGAAFEKSLDLLQAMEAFWFRVS